MAQTGRSVRPPPASTRDNTMTEQYDTSSQPPQAEDWLTKVTFPKFQTLPEVTCVYGMDGKCSGTITPQRLIILQDAYNSACHRGTHALLSLPVQDLAAEIHEGPITSPTPTTLNDRQQYQG